MVVLRRCRQRLVVDRDECPVDDVDRIAGGGGVAVWVECLGQVWSEIVYDTVHGGLAGVEHGGEGSGRQVRAQVDQDEQESDRQRQRPRPTVVLFGLAEPEQHRPGTRFG